MIEVNELIKIEKEANSKETWKGLNREERMAEVEKLIDMMLRFSAQVGHRSCNLTSYRFIVAELPTEDLVEVLRRYQDHYAIELELRYALARSLRVRYLEFSWVDRYKNGLSIKYV